MRPAFCLLVFGLLLSVGCLWQWRGDALGSDLGGDPDEAAHAVTSLMVRDYLFQPESRHPLRHAEAYYERLPKVALGHYPPGYYALAGLCLGPAPSITALLVLQAVLLAGVGTLITVWASRMMPWWAALGCGVLACLAPPLQKLLLLVMSDLLLTLCCLLATAAMASFLERPRAMAALGFGFAAAAAILVKGSGLMLALVPPLALLLSGKWRLALRPVLWIAPVPVVVLALPWQLYSFKFTKEGMSGLSVGDHFKKAFGYYGEAAEHHLGMVLPVLLGMVVAVALLRRLRGVVFSSNVAALGALLGAGLVLTFTVPAGMSPRYLVPLVPPALVLLVHGVAAGWSLVAARPGGWGAGLGLVGAAVSLALTGQVLPAAKNVHGYGGAVEAIVSSGRTAPAWLICSDARGEGAVIAAAAFQPVLRQSGQLRVLRGTKELATMDWLGRGYTAAFADAAALRRHLEKEGVAVVLVDEAVPDASRMPYHHQLVAALEEPGSGWKLDHRQQVTRGRDRGELKVFVMDRK